VNDLIPPWTAVEALPCVYGGAVGSGVIRAAPEDFRVDEDLGFEPDGEGDHLLLQIRKRETNTLWLARRLADLAGVERKDVGYAGLKDRHAVTSQWFSVLMAGRPEPDWGALEAEQVQVLQVRPHRRKLRVGALRGNRFRMRVRELQADRTALEARLHLLREGGMPNYFGEQRFGRDYSNLAQAHLLFQRKLRRIDRKLRGLLISAARSQLFNQVLAARVEQGSWNQPIPGDYMNLNGSRSGFAIEALDATLAQRCREMDIHPTAPLWGRGRSLVSGDCLALEERVLEPFADWRNGLEHVGLAQERRPMRIRVGDLQWRFPDDACLEIEFSLPAGSYATVLLRELLQTTSPTAASG
jgi:tRNA pseudouridine13 synthase